MEWVPLLEEWEWDTVLEENKLSDAALPNGAENKRRVGERGKTNCRTPCAPHQLRTSGDRLFAGGSRAAAQIKKSGPGISSQLLPAVYARAGTYRVGFI